MTERWTQRDHVGPRPHFAANRFVYDAERSVAILLGIPSVSGDSGETWEWDSSSWVQTDDMGPQADIMNGHDTSMVFAPDRHACIAYLPNSPAAQTWERSNAVWTQIADTGPLGTHGLVYDISRSRCVAMSVQPAQASLQTWEWDGSAWTMVEDTGPPTRSSFALTYDSKNKVTILYGGVVSGDSAAFFGDTWAWDGTRWKQVSDMGPSDRHSAAMIDDDNKARILLFGGRSAENGIHGDTWQWDGALWHQLSDMGPPVRFGSGMCYDSQRQRAVLFGGSPSVFPPLFGDTWEFFDQA